MAEFREDHEEDENDEPRWTPLQLAAQEGDLGRVQALLSSGSEDVNAPPSGYYGRTALQAACLGAHVDVVRALLAAGADVHAAGGNNSTRTALQLACGVRPGDEEEEEGEGEARDAVEAVVEMLLAAGADIHTPASRYYGRTALQAAAESGRLALVTMLLRRGADANAPPATTAGVTALQAACIGGHVDVARALLAEAAGGAAAPNAPACRHKGFTALQAACLAKSAPLVELLLAAGADPDAPGSRFRGGTALHAAAHKGDAAILRRLLAAGASVNIVAGPANQTPLQSALLNDQTECAEILKEAGGVCNESRAVFLFEH